MAARGRQPSPAQVAEEDHVEQAAMRFEYDRYLTLVRTARVESRELLIHDGHERDLYDELEAALDRGDIPAAQAKLMEIREADRVENARHIRIAREVAS